MIRILLADDNETLLDDLQELLRPEFELVGAVTDGHALVEAARKLAPDLIVSDIEMPGLDGFEASRRVLRERPGMPIVLLTCHKLPSLLDKAFDMGILGYVAKSDAGEDLIPALHEVSKGRRFSSSSVPANSCGLAR